MQRSWRKLKAVYSNLRIKYKVFLLISILMLAVSGISLAVHQYAFEAYEGEIYRQAAKSLQLSSSGIESELKKMERMSFRIATDQEMQEYLNIIGTSDSEYERYFAINQIIKERLPNIGGLEKYVLSLQLFDYQNKEYPFGVNAILSSQERAEDIVTLAARDSGGARWIDPGKTDSALILVREIRSIENLNFLDHLGTIAIRIDMNGLLADFARGLNSSNAHFLIVNDGKPVYPNVTTLPVDEIRARLSSGQGYQTLVLDGNRYFITHAPSNYLNWTYMILIPYDDIFFAISTVKTTVLVLYVIMTVLAVLAAIRFSRGITKPIESLNAKMKKVQFGHFEDDGELYDNGVPMDEAGQLHRNFRIMVGRINELIRENYLKQLTIKESEFKALQAQINPHFLYNTLESINWLAKMDGQQHISRMVESLGFLLRSSISQKAPLITVREEIEIVRNYITIQKIRFEERLDFAIDIPHSVVDNLIPKLSLQPLVENSINYGLEQMLETCVIRISASVSGDELIICVADNGPGMDRELLEKLQTGEIKARGSGLGLRNIDERIRLLFGEGYGLTVDSKHGEGTRVTLRLPIKTEETVDV